MNGGMRLGRIRGVAVEVHWLVLVVGLAVASLIAQRLGGSGGLSPGWSVAIGGGFVLGYLLSVLAHEIGHMIVAQRRGIGVRRIVLHFYGGAAELERSAESPSSQFWVAFAGPAASACCAATAAALAALWTRGEWIPAGDAARSLAWANLLMVGINLFPAAPLDGGHVMSALIWQFTGDRERSTRITGWIGMVTGIVLCVTALWMLVSPAAERGGYSSYAWWFLFLGWFLVSAADGPRRSASPALVLAGGSPVGGLMERVTPAQPDWVPLSWLWEQVGSPNPAHPYLPLSDHRGTLSGLVDRARVEHAVASGLGNRPASELAWPLDALAYATPDERVADVDERLRGQGAPVALVLSRGVPVGVWVPASAHA